MRVHRTFVPGLASLALIIVLAACGQAVANPPSPAPSPTESPAPSPTDSPTPQPSESPTPSPTPAPIDSPSAPPTVPPPASPIQVVQHDLPMVGRATTDGVNVRSVPSIHAPLLSGQRLSDGSIVPNIRLRAGELVLVTLGPVVADGESWYEVSVADGADVNWAFGWVAGRYLEREGDVPAYSPVIVDISGVGTGATATADVTRGTPVTVRFAAAPMSGRDTCEIDVTVIRTDGLGVNVAAETLTDTRAYELSSFQLPSLFQEEAGTVTLQVTTDCAFAATLTMPQA